MTDPSQARRDTDSRVRGTALAFAGSGGFLLWVSGWSALINMTQLQVFIGQVGGLLLASGMVTFVWEQWGRRNFAGELMAMANLSTDLKPKLRAP